MTETPFTSTAAPTDSGQADPRVDSEGTLEHLRPGDLEIDTNIRDEAVMDPQFLASIREHGVLQPVTAFRGADGIVKVRDGQLRTLAAREAGVATMPVYVRDINADTDAKTQAAERIVHQIVTNEHRAALTDAQRAKGIQQMLLSGISAAKVAKRLAVRRDTIDAAATAATSPVAMAALDAGQLNLQEAAALTEFDDGDDDHATEALLKVAGTAMFDHTVAQLRQNRADRQARTQAAAHYAGQGYTVLDQMPEWRDKSKVALRYLRTADSHVATEQVVTDPAHWAVLLVQSQALVDTQTGETVHEDQVDWNTEDDPDAQPEDGLRHARTVVERTVWVPEFYCTNTEAAGLTLAEFLQNQRPIVHNPGGGDDQDDDAAAAARADAERRERRKVLTLNKLGLAAQEVRRRFVTDLLRRKTAPKGSAQFIATCLAQSPNLPADYNAHQVIAQFLGLGDNPLKQAVCDLPENADARAEVIVLGMLLAALEGRTPKDAWRDATSRYAQWGPPDYLKWLARNGYQLAPVEQIVARDKAADEVFTDTEAQR